jgi:hypothetical protein
VQALLKDTHATALHNLPTSPSTETAGPLSTSPGSEEIPVRVVGETGEALEKIHHGAEAGNRVIGPGRGVVEEYR